MYVDALIQIYLNSNTILYITYYSMCYMKVLNL